MIAECTTAPTGTVWDVLNRNLFFVKNAVKASELKTSDKLDIYDPETRSTLLECREPNIGMLTQLARAFGGEHDQGVAFNLVARIPGSNKQAFRVARKGTSFTFGGVPMQFLDQQDQLIGTMKKETFKLGHKFTFARGKETVFVLEVKTKLLSADCEILIHDSPVAWLQRSGEGEHAEYFKQEKFSYSISFAPELPLNSPVRQLLLAFCSVIHRVNA